MQVNTKEPKAKYKVTKCEVCSRRKRSTWHHIEHRRYGDKWIWACVFNGKEAGCHEKIHNPTAYGLESDWAYKNGYLLRHNTKTDIKPKIFKPIECSHKKTYNTFEGDIIHKICMICKKEVK